MTTSFPAQSRPLLSQFEVAIPHDDGEAGFHYDESKMILMFGDVPAAQAGKEYLARTTKVTFVRHETRDDD